MYLKLIKLLQDGRFIDNNGQVISLTKNIINSRQIQTPIEQINKMYEGIILRKKQFNILLINLRTLKDLDNLLQSSRFRFRPGILEILKQIETEQFPFVIVSNGIDYFIKYLLQNLIIHHPALNLDQIIKNIYLFCNKLISDDQGFIKSQSMDLFPAEKKINFISTQKDLKLRKNSLIIGNSFHDGKIKMKSDNESTIKCAMHCDLHVDSIKFFEESGGNYDVVVKSDGNLFFPLWIIKSILDKDIIPKTIPQALNDNTFNESYLEFIMKNHIKKLGHNVYDDKEVKWIIQKK